jgi:cytosine/adenosine deaminase-related metal-dependent hydrolase
MEIFHETWAQGRKAVGENAKSFFKIGAPLDGIVLNPKHPVFLGKPENRIISSLIYAGDARCFLSTLKYGEAVVSGGRHHAYERICETYQSAIEPKS